MGSCGDSRVLDSGDGHLDASPEARAAVASYWLDAFDDIDASNSLELAASAPPLLSADGDTDENGSFFCEIDQIIESIRSGADQGFGELGEIIGEEAAQQPAPAPAPAPDPDPVPEDAGDAHCEGARRDFGGARDGAENGARKGSRRRDEIDGDGERFGKGRRVGDRGSGRRGEWAARRRPRREWEEGERRERKRDRERP